MLGGLGNDIHNVPVAGRSADMYGIRLHFGPPELEVWKFGRFSDRDGRPELTEHARCFTVLIFYPLKLLELRLRRVIALGLRIRNRLDLIERIARNHRLSDGHVRSWRRWADRGFLGLRPRICYKCRKADK